MSTVKKDFNIPSLPVELTELAVESDALIATPFSGLSGVGTVFPPDQIHIWDCVSYIPETGNAWWRVSRDENGQPRKRV